MAESTYDKKLRYSEPDLKIVLKFTDNDNNPDEKVYPMYAPIIARLSNFIDTSLSVEMKERALKEIVFQDVRPELFEKALKYQQDPKAIRSMTLGNALEVLPFYDKYEFVGGLELCDSILSEYIENNQAQPKDLNLLVATTVAGYKYNLPKSKKEGCDCLNAKVLEEKNANLLKAAALTIDHIKALQSLFHEGLLSLPDGIEREDVADNPLFPVCLAKYMSSRFFERSGSVNYHLSLNGCGCILSPSQVFARDGDGRWKSKNFLIWKKFENRDWTIVDTRGMMTKLWKSPNSKSLPVPPTGPWEPISTKTQGTCPIVEYN